VQNIGLPVDHSGLNKFEAKDANYVALRSKLLEVITPVVSQRQHTLYSVPLETVGSFTERHTISSAIEEKLRTCDASRPRPYAVAIYGLGGTGKTQLALKYIEDHKGEYNPILWINARDPETVRSSFERCARELRIPVDRASLQGLALEDSATVQAVLRWLRDRKESDEEWLVVIDSVDDFSWGVKNILPKGQRGNVIVTSQDEQSPKLFRGGCEKVLVDTMERTEARSLLLRHLDRGPQLVEQDVHEVCDRIVERLGYLALAVDLAGAYIGEDSNPESALRQYLADYSKHQDELLRSDHFRGLSGYSKTVWTVWDTALEKIEQRYADARPGLLLAFLARFKGGFIQDELFRLASFGFAAVKRKIFVEQGGFPDWLKKLMAVEGEEWDRFRYREALKPLVRYNLLKREEGEWAGVRIHGLVQWRAMKYEEHQPWDFWYLEFILAVCCQISQEAGWPQFRRHMLVHIPDTSQVFLGEKGIMDKGKAKVWETISMVYSDEKRWKEAEELCVRVVETLKRVLGEEHPRTLAGMGNLASTFLGQGRWKDAEELLVLVMEAHQRVLGEEHPSTLTSIGNLASTYSGQGRWKEAEELEVQVVETRKKILGEEHPDTLGSISNLASTYLNQGRWKEAEELFVQVMETRKRVLGAEHPDTLTGIANLALTYRSQGRWKEAEELLVQVVETRRRVLGEEHPDILDSTADLVLTYMNQGRWNEAEELEGQVIETRKRVLGVEHPNTLTGMANLASTYGSQGRWKEAEELLVLIMETSKTKLGAEHPSTLTSIGNLASTYGNQGRWKEAEELFVQVIETSKRVLGAEHPDTLTGMDKLALTYWNQGRWNEAE
jgi:tetratricopeptide (TPR) repeat protein